MSSCVHSHFSSHHTPHPTHHHRLHAQAEHHPRLHHPARQRCCGSVLDPPWQCPPSRCDPGGQGWHPVLLGCTSSYLLSHTPHTLFIIFFAHQNGLGSSPFGQVTTTTTRR